MIKHNIHSIFPKFLFQGMAPNDLIYSSQEVLKSVDIFNGNGLNGISKDAEILNTVEFKELKKFIDDCLNIVFYNYYGSTEEVEIYITSSWVNELHKNAFHYPHYHPNSFFSGVYYFDNVLPEDGGLLTIINSTPPSLIVDASNGMGSMSSVDVLPESGKLIIFPSELYHCVTAYTGEKPRYSLAFNTFISGNISKIRTMKLKL